MSEERKSFLNELSEKKPESFREEQFVAVKRSRKPVLFAIAFIMIAAAVFFMIRAASQTEVPDMTGWKLEEAQNWIKKRHAQTTLTGEYNMEQPENYIVTQDIEPGIRIKSSAVLTLVYSMGADPNESVELPELKKMTVQQIRDWIDEYKLTGVSVKYENSEVITKDSVIAIEYIDGDADSFLRKSRMMIYVSSGSESEDVTVAMPDFIGKSKLEVLRWADEYSLSVDFEEEFNSYYELGTVIAQSIKKETKITRKDSILIRISRGKPITVPDFSGMLKSAASELAALYGIKALFDYQEGTKNIDRVIAQSISAGIEIDGSEAVTLTIVQKSERIAVPDFKGLTTQEANSLAGLYGLKLFIKGLPDSSQSGTIVSQSVAPGDTIHMNDVVTLTAKASKSDQTVPNFIGMDRNEATVAAQNSSLQIVFNEIDTIAAANDTVIAQSIDVGSAINGSTSILLDIAVSSGVIAEDLTCFSKQEAQNWSEQKGVKLNIIEQYSDIYPSGALFNQAPASGLIPKGGSITLYCSLGKIGIDSFIGKPKLDILDWQTEVNGKGANISLVFIPIYDSTSSKGTITDQSVKYEQIGTNTEITVWVSDADNNGVRIPNLENRMEAEFKQWCSLNSVPYVILESYSDSIPKGRVFGQNFQDSFLPAGEYLRIYLSLGRVYIEDFTGKALAAAEAWRSQVNQNGANINLLIEQEYSDVVSAGNVIRQSTTNQEIGLYDTIIITVSMGTRPT